MDITLAFRKLSLINGEQLTLSISPSVMQKMILELVANGYLTTEELIIYAIGQVKLCDQNHLEHVLPESVLKKLNATYESAKNGENHV